MVSITFHHLPPYSLPSNLGGMNNLPYRSLVIVNLFALPMEVGLRVQSHVKFEPISIHSIQY